MYNKVLGKLNLQKWLKKGTSVGLDKETFLSQHLLCCMPVLV